MMGNLNRIMEIIEGNQVIFGIAYTVHIHVEVVLDVTLVDVVVAGMMI